MGKFKVIIIISCILLGLAVLMTFLFVKIQKNPAKQPNSIKSSMIEDAVNLISPASENQADLIKAASDSENLASEIKMIYPTKKNGRTWVNKWENGNARNLDSGRRDPFDSELIVRGDGEVSIDGEGVAKISGEAPRMYIYDRGKKKKWKNVEVTVYAKRVSESKKVSYQGIVIGARSDHQNANEKNACAGESYYGRLLYDGRAVFQKEIVHEGAYSSNKPKENNKVSWNTPDGTMPKDEWIGVKFIVRNNPNKKFVKLELYRDLTGGVNGGNWEKVAEYTDKGHWAQSNSGINIMKKCGHSANKILNKPGTSVFIRNDYVTDAEYKWFSIREID